MNRKYKALRHDPNDLFNTVPAGHQGCTRCGEVKPISEYHKRCAGINVLRSHCKECDAKLHFIHRHGIGSTEWKRDKLERQGGVCGVCGTDDPGGKGWHLHHNPRYGKGRASWREVTCGNCNASAIAGFENSKNPKALLKWLYDNFEDITGQEPPELS